MTALGASDLYVAALMGRLENRLPALIAADNVAHPEYELKVPVGYTDGTEDFLHYPWVEVFVGEGEINNLSLMNVDGDLNVTVGVLAHVQEALSATRLYRLLVRLGDAIVAAASEPGAFGVRNPTIAAIRWRTRRSALPDNRALDQVFAAAHVEFLLQDVVRLYGG